MKAIKKVEVTPIDYNIGKIIDSAATTDDKTKNTYSMRVIDSKVSDINSDISDINSELDGLSTYSSTTEQVVGTWTDGKPIYRKVVDTGNIGDGALYYENAYVKNLNISNLDKIIKYETYAKALNDYLVSINTHTWFDTFNNILASLHTLINDYGDFICITDTNIIPVHLISSYVIVEYTKTTD